jgi:hypothetical protein
MDLGGTSDLSMPHDLGTSSDLAVQGDFAPATPDLHSGALTLTLDPSLDGDDGDVKATTFTSAVLLDRDGRSVESATLVSGSASFSLAGLAAGDYFIAVNGDRLDLVPTRIDDPSQDVTQRVGTKLRASRIGPVLAPVYRLMTYSLGQMQSPAIRFSDGSSLSGEQPYVLVTFNPPKIEFKALGSASALASYAPSALHNGEPFDSWLLNTAGQPHHGDEFNADGGASVCGHCHVAMDTKPAFYGAVEPANGWCYRCHYGTEGSGRGFVDPTL